MYDMLWYLTQPTKKIINLDKSVWDIAFQPESMEFKKCWDGSHSESSKMNDYNCSMDRNEQDWKAPWLEPQPHINQSKDNLLYS